ncbi:MAG: hypothetical protein ACJAXT_001258 [Paracoccaceae bacterium]|jgi:hypothetical protein
MSNDEKKELGPYKRAVLEATERAGAIKREDDGMVLFEFPNYESYRDVQVTGNKSKLRMQFVKESHIKILADYVNDTVGEISFGLCHGTRRGAEQSWFRTHLTGRPNVIGTEISDTATEFPHTVQWDFHDKNPDWDGNCDFVYSNSWDHAFDPVKAFGAWIDALKPGGLMLLDYTKGQSPDDANALDPFGITYEKLLTMLKTNFDTAGYLLEKIDTRKTNKEYRALVVVFQKNAQVVLP